MTEETFNLTPLDIRTQQFRRGFRGYDLATVEEFRERCAAEVERLLRENSVFAEQVRNFREQLKLFREREKAMSDALVVAQQLREDSEQMAQKESDRVVQQARVEAGNIITDARQAEQSVRRDTEHLHAQLASYLTSFRVLLERNLAEVEAVETAERNGRALAAATPSMVKRPSLKRPELLSDPTGVRGE